MKKKQAVKSSSISTKSRNHNSINAKFTGDAANAIRRLMAITKRNRDEVFCDAFTTYLWAIHQQTFDAKVASKKGDWEDQLTNLVKDKAKAIKYFEELGW